jgi:hypothetical protein
MQVDAETFAATCNHYDGALQMSKNSTFILENKTFEVSVAILDQRFCVKVFL